MEVVLEGIYIHLDLGTGQVVEVEQVDSVGPGRYVKEGLLGEEVESIDLDRYMVEDVRGEEEGSFADLRGIMDEL